MLRADILAGLATLPDGVADLVVADPDWAIRTDLATAHHRNRTKFTQHRSGFDWMRAGDPTDPTERRDFMNRWVGEVGRVLRSGGHFVCWFDAQRITHVYEATASWSRPVWRQVLAWVKSTPVPQAGCVNFCSALELAAWVTKDTASKRHATFNAKLGQVPNVAVATQVRGHARTHPAQKPDAILEWLVAYLSREGDIVVDAFAGSFALSKVALAAGRKIVAIEREARYCRAFSDWARASGHALNIHGGSEDVEQEAPRGA